MTVIMKHGYYYNLIARVLTFVIPKKKTILYYGYYNKNIITALNSSYCVCITEEEYKGEPIPNILFIQSHFENYIPEQKFDYIVLDIALGITDDICLLLKNISIACTSNTRIIIHQENYLWQYILKIASLIGLKNKEKTQNWLSVGDIRTYLKSTGFEATRSFNKNIFPLKLGFLGPLINSIFIFIPILDFFKLDQFVIARFLPEPKENQSLTICITVRNEEANIEPIVSTLPIICNNQEIIFVEGHSDDNTIGEIEKMQSLYPEKNIKLIHQKGIGQGDAIRLGFFKAKGDIIILYEGDGTSEPSDIIHFYNCINNGFFEFIEGSRLSYKSVSGSMPFINKLGNIFFAKWFSMFLKQRTTDVLSGIKAMRRKDYDLIYESWGFLKVVDPFGDFELLYGSARYGLKIGEIPIRYKPRLHGVSKTNILKHGSYLLKMAWRGFIVFRRLKQN